MPKITPFLWFDQQAEEAAKFYTSVFRNSRIVTAISFSVDCKTQEEVDEFWTKLSEADRKGSAAGSKPASGTEVAPPRSNNSNPRIIP